MSAGGDGAPQTWGAWEVMQQAWEIVKVHWIALIFGPLIGGVIGGLPGQILQAAGQATGDPTTTLVTSLLGGLIGFFIQTFFTAGTIQLAVRAARGGSPEVMQVFQGGSAYLRLLGTSLLVGLAVLAGFLLLIVPGVVLALGLSMAPYYAVDAGMGPVEAMKASWSAMKGHKGNLFLYGLASMLVVMLGLLACCIGMFPAQAVVITGTAIIYTRVSGGAGGGAPPAFGSFSSPFAGYPPGGHGSGPIPPPGGGWGAA